MDQTFNDDMIFIFFVLEEIEAIPDRLFITLGSRFGNNTYSGFALMPTARAVYQFNQRRMAWAAVSHAVRSPAAIDTSLRFDEGTITEPDGTPAVIRAIGNPHVKDEGLVAYEAGYRMTVGKTLSVDLAAYYNDYDHQNSEEPGTPFLETTPAPPHLVLPIIEENLNYGETHGAEIAAKWKLTSRWTIDPSYDFERLHFHRAAGSQDLQTGPSARREALRDSRGVSGRTLIFDAKTWAGTLRLISWIGSRRKTCRRIRAWIRMSIWRLRESF